MFGFGPAQPTALTSQQTFVGPQMQWSTAVSHCVGPQMQWSTAVSHWVNPVSRPLLALRCNGQQQ